MQWCHRLDADYGVDPWIWQSLHGPSFHLSSKLCLCNSFNGCFVPNSKEWVPGQTGLHREKPVSKQQWQQTNKKKMWRSMGKSLFPFCCLTYSGDDNWNHLGWCESQVYMQICLLVVHCVFPSNLFASRRATLMKHNNVSSTEGDIIFKVWNLKLQLVCISLLKFCF